MIDLKLKEDILDLYDEGVEIELLADELRVPASEIENFIKEYKEEKEQSDVKKQEKIHTHKTEKTHKKPQSKLEIMREKYANMLSRKVAQEAKNETRSITPEEKALLDETFAEFRKISKNMHNLSQSEKYAAFFDFTKSAKKIKGIPTSIAQSEEALDILETFLAECHKIEVNDSAKNNYRIIRSMFVTNLCEAIDEKVSATNDIDELKKYSKILLKYTEHIDFVASGVQFKLNQKQHDLLRTEAMKKIRYDVPEEVRQIIVGIADGNLDTENAINTINRIAKERVEKLPKTRFSLTEEQQKNQLLLQVRTVLSERANEFKVEDPLKSIELLTELTEHYDYDKNVLTIIRNLYKSGRIDVAKQIAGDFRKRKTENIEYRNVEKEITKFEIGSMVQNMINTLHSKEEEEAFISVLGKKLESSKIPLTAIPVGTTEDSLKTILLSDIWFESPKKQK